MELSTVALPISIASKPSQQEIAHRKNIIIAVIFIGVLLGTGALLAAFAFPVLSVPFCATMASGLLCFGMTAIAYQCLKLKPENVDEELPSPEDEKLLVNPQEELQFKLGFKVNFPFSVQLSNAELAKCKACTGMLRRIFLNNQRNLTVSKQISIFMIKELLVDAEVYQTLLNALKGIKLSVSNKLNPNDILYEDDRGAGVEILKRTDSFLTWVISQYPKQAQLAELKNACV